MYSQGEVKASELIKMLEKLIARHGDRYVFCTGGDYPEPVSGVRFNSRESDGYIPKGVFVL